MVAETDDEVVDAVRAADAAGEPLLVLGGGSNLVVADAGFDGTVLQLATRGVAVAPLAEHALQVEAGVDWDARRARSTVDEGYAGLEALSGIPGRSAPPRSRTSAPTARRSPRPSAGFGSWTGRPTTSSC